MSVCWEAAIKIFGTITEEDSRPSICTSTNRGCLVFATGCQCSLAPVIRFDITLIHGSLIFCFCSAEVRSGPCWPSRGCLLSANIIIAHCFLVIARVCVCVCVVGTDIELYAFIKTLPSVSTATSFSLLLFYNLSPSPRTAGWNVPPLSHVQPAVAA